MRLEYLIRRLVLFVVVVWVAATINFILPRLSGGNAIRNQLTAQSDAVSQSIVRHTLELGLRDFSRDDLEAVRKARPGAAAG